MTSSATTIDSLIAQLPEQIERGTGADHVRQLLDALADASWPSWEETVTRLQAASPAANLAMLQAAQQRWPERSDIAFLLGNHLRVRGDVAEAERVLRAALAHRPDDVNVGLSLSYLLREQGRLGAANEVVRDTWQQGPRSRKADFATLQLLCENQGHALASSILPGIVEAHPHDGAMLALAGEIELLLGHFERAAEYLRLAVQADPASAPSWLRLAQTHRFESRDDADYRALLAARVDTRLLPKTQAAIAFALAKAESDLGEHAAAVDLLRTANRAERERADWNAEAWADFARTEAQATPLLGSDQGMPFTPVFIVGMPRSGTTLTAELLARRGDVRNRGELNWIAAIAARLGNAPDRAALRHAGQMIATQLRRDDAPAQVYIDKNPLNFRHLRLIAALFPQAKVIHCRRDRRDTALSIWSQLFEHADLGWTYDFGDIAAFETGYRQIMATSARLGLPIFDLDYADLVSDTEATLAKLHAFLGLPSKSAPRASTDEVAIATASVWQARQPVHRDSIGRWKQFETLLPELVKAIPAT